MPKSGMGYRLIVVFTLLYSSLAAQFKHEAVLPGLEGDELLVGLVDQYLTSTTMGYGPARDTLYGIVYNVNDTVAGIYTDHKLYLPPGEDPTSFLLMDGVPNGINAEHSYPQSKGAGSGNPRSDMHHLFPARIAANSARGSLPFGEINDSTTDFWYYKTIEKSSLPTPDQIDLFSEKTEARWEPRESVKGNIARAIFYFYTMYRQQADSADPDFFWLMKDDLCAWHELDPVDELEWERTKMIAKWQEGKSNPFVLDCSVAYRTYCGDITAACQLVPMENESLDEFKLKGNVVGDALEFSWTFVQKEEMQYAIYDAFGRRVQKGELSLAQEFEARIPLQTKGAGLYFIRFWSPDSNKAKTLKFYKAY